MSKRYIDADALVKAIEDCSFVTWSEGVNRAWWAQAVLVKDNLMRCIERQPAADVVEVVRCKDCRWCDVTNWDGEILYGCDCCGGMNDIAPDYFCSYGERKDGNEG